jgi:hypothetical protein
MSVAKTPVAGTGAAATDELKRITTIHAVSASQRLRTDPINRPE